MKVNEIMIGDWVMHKDMRILRINGIYGERVYDEDNFVYRIDSLNPIPLTPEILEKNDWGYDGMYYSDDIYKSNFVYETEWYPNEPNLYIHIKKTKNEITLCIHQGHEGHGDLRYCKFVNVKYVHELQHALRLCGLNELADNFIV